MSLTTNQHPEKYSYIAGLGMSLGTEAIPDAIEADAHIPSKLRVEILSGTPYMAPRCNEHPQTRLYRILPPAVQARFKDETSSWSRAYLPKPGQQRWDPFAISKSERWMHSFHTIAGAGDPTTQSGLSIMVFSAGKSMGPREAFYSADGDFLIVAQQGVLDIQTELGNLLVRPNEVVVIPRGIRYRVTLPAGPARGYALELFQGHFQLSEKAKVNPYDFQVPVAAFQAEVSAEWDIYCKFGTLLFRTKQSQTPFDIGAWRGDYYPYKVDLSRLSVAAGSLEADSSTLTVLTAPSGQDTVVANLIALSPRWLTSEGVPSAPWYQRTPMARFIGLISGHQRRKGSGLQPGGATLLSAMTAYSPDTTQHDSAVTPGSEVDSFRLESLGFIFETSLMLQLTEWASSRTTF